MNCRQLLKGFNFGGTKRIFVSYVALEYVRIKNSNRMTGLQILSDIINRNGDLSDNDRHAIYNAVDDILKRLSEKDQRKFCAAILIDSFDWSNMPPGSEYWDDIYMELVE